MARPLRIEFPGALYHVTARGNARQAIVLDDEDRAAFGGLLGRVVERYGLRLHAFCLLDNHYHLFRPGAPGAGARAVWPYVVMQDLTPADRSGRNEFSRSTPRPAAPFDSEIGGERIPK